MMKKLLLYLLIFSLLLTVLSVASCQTKPDSGKTTDAETTTQSSGTTEATLDPNIEAVDGKGKEFVILNRKYTPLKYNNHPYNEFTVLEDVAESINEAVYRRNKALEEKYNIKIVSDTPSDSITQLRKLITQSYQAGTDDYQLASLALREAFYLATQGQLTEISDIPYLDPSKPWWSDELLEVSSVNHKNHFIVGDMNLGAYNTVACVLFNKDLIEELNLENPYTLVKENEWTFDKMMDMCKVATLDLDANNEMDYKDRYGYLGSSAAYLAYYFSNGGTFIKKDSSDIPYFTALGEREVSLLLKIIEMFNDKSAIYNVNHQSTFSDGGKLHMDMFLNNQGLFQAGNLYSTIPLRDMASDWGVLPTPKYDDYSEYVSLLHNTNGTAMCVPLTNEDLDFVGRVMEDMGYYSYQYVRPAYFEVTLMSRDVRDPESVEMLEYVLKNLSVDFALLMQTNGIDIDTLMRDATTKNDKNIVSKITSKIDSYNVIIKNIVKAFE